MKALAITIFFLIPACLPSQQNIVNITANLKADNAFLDSTYQKISGDTISLQRFLSLSQKNKNKTAESFFLNKLGVFYRNKSNYSRAFDLHQKALEIAEDTKNLEQTIISQNLLGVVFRRRDDIIPAIKYHQKALELAESVKHPNETILRNIAISCNSLGNVYLTMNQLDDALEYFRRSLGIEEKINNQLGLAINHQNIGGIFEKKNDLETALKNYRKSLFYNKRIHSKLGELICNNSIGGIYLKQGRLAEAEKYILPTIKESEEIQDDFYTALSYINTGWLFMLQNKSKAKSTILKGLKISKKNNFTSSTIDACELLSKLYQKENKVDSALIFYKIFATEKEKLNSENTFKSINELKNKYILEKRKNEINELREAKEEMMIKMNSTKLIFYVSLILIIMGIIFYYFMSRQKQLRQERKMLLMEQDLIRLQMNPHFIFNALNSIKSYIVKNDTENSVYYLNKFAKIFRNVLTGIQQKETTLKKELENVENYLSIENMRFGGTIDYTIEIDESINTEAVKVPAFLLQVFVENAIWHGLAIKKDEKKLNIKISRSNSKISIEIQDNGIGRKKSEEINNTNPSRKESQGILISERRLESFYAKEYSLKILDLVDDQNRATGTFVQLKIPQ
ncbi:tetratricopeptide repeat-containing sensor histidine kinase [Chryseobacterium koreense]